MSLLLGHHDVMASRHLPSPAASSERRQVITVGRNPTMPSFTQLDGDASPSPPPASLPPPPSTASTYTNTHNTATFPPLVEPHCPTGSVEYHADYGDLPPGDAPPGPACASCSGPTEWASTRRLEKKNKHGYRCLALCMGEATSTTTYLVVH